MTKIIFIITGILTIFLSVFLSYGILIYTGKESDNSGYWHLGFSFIVLVIGLLVLRKGLIRKA